MVIGLKTVKGTKQLKLDPSIHDSLQVGGRGGQEAPQVAGLPRARCAARVRQGLAQHQRRGATARLVLLLSFPQKEKVAPGDVIYIEANSGAVKRVGRQAGPPTPACPSRQQPVSSLLGTTAG